MVQITKLNQIGDHIILIAVCIALFGVIGTFFLLQDYAATPSPELKSGISLSKGPYCLDDHGDGGNGAEVDDYQCNGSAAQHYSYSDGEIHLGTGCVYVEGASATNFPKQAPVLISTSCSTAPWGGLWTQDGNYFLNNHSDSKGGKYCLDITGGAVADAHVEIYPCTYGSNESWTATAYGSGSTGGTGSGGTSGVGSALLSEAESKFSGIPYSYGGGHDWSSFYDDCLDKSYSTKPSASNSVCEVDCSGLVSMTVDMYEHESYTWIVTSTPQGWGMVGTDSNLWQPVSLNNVQAGDIVTGPGSGEGHVEFVVSGSGAKDITTFGAHYTGTDDSVAKPGSPDSFIPTNAWRFE